MDFKHTPVMLEETLRLLCVKDNGLYIDGTLGGAGHARGILSAAKDVRLIGIDRDGEALAAAALRLKEFGDRVTLVHANFSEIKSILAQKGIEGADGILLDLGVSSYQLDNPERGFSYQYDAPLDMRMDKSQYLNAYHVVNEYSERELYRVIRDYGEEQWASRIAQFIVEERQRKSIETTFELVDVIKKAIPTRARRTGPHPARRTFQAIRIEVNNELGGLEQSIRDAVDSLNPGGRLCVITFHSLEDRVVKRVMQNMEKPCTCPPKLPVCVCGAVPKGKVIGRFVMPSAQEMESNPRSKSAKLRCFEKA